LPVKLSYGGCSFQFDPHVNVSSARAEGRYFCCTQLDVTVTLLAAECAVI
jgi:hypothetical protein